MEGKVDIWYEGFLVWKDDLSNWYEFTKAMCIRFGNQNDVVEEFNKLEQEKKCRGICREV
jgi:hypothetical protein